MQILIFVFIQLLQGVMSQNPSLAPTGTVIIAEHNPITFNCTYISSTTPTKLSWVKDDFQSFFAARVYGCTEFIPDPPGYTEDCSVDGDTYTYTLNILNVTMADEGQSWKCMITTTNSNKRLSDKSVITVTVPITSVTMTNPAGNTVSVIENTPSAEFVCETTAGRPEATVTWYRKPASSSTGPVEITGGSVTNRNVGGLTVVTGRLSYRPPRSVDGWLIYCTASNVQGDVKTSTREPSLNVLYPPSTPTLTYDRLVGPSINTSPVKVIRGDDVKIGCTASGDPEPSYSWSSQSGTSQILTINNIQTDTTRTCTATNTMVPTVGTRPGHTSATSTVSIKVMYGPSVPSLFYNGSSIVPATVSVIEGSTFPTITCSGSSSNPSPPFYSWSGSVTSTSGSLNLVNVGKHQAGIFTCRVQNIMVRSYGDTTPVVGNSNKTFTLNVLYYPHLSDKVIINITSAKHETASLSVTVLAYPEPSNYVWAKLTGSIWTDLTSSTSLHISSQGLQTNLTILDVKQADYGQYRLTVTNTVGVFQQVFFVTQQEKPGPPTNLRYSQDLVTKWSATVQWEPGFEGGLPHTFNVYYRPIYTAMWTRETILHQTSGVSMNVTLTGLNAGSTYEVQVYAINDIGNSSTDIVLFATKENLDPIPESVTIPAGAIGGAAGGLVVVMLVILAVIFSRKYKIVKKNDNANPDDTRTSTTDMAKDITNRKATNVPQASVRIFNTVEESDMSSQYTALERNDNPTDSYTSLQNIELSETKQSTYENLKV